MSMEPEKGTVLVVDDEPEIRQLLRILLSNRGYTVVEAANGAAAVEQAKVHRDLDLILMDIMMPGLSGMEACRQLRVFTHAPLMFLTARNTEEDRQQAYDNGGDDFLAKPFSPTELLRKVQALIRRYRVYDSTGAARLRPGMPADTLQVDAARRTVEKQGESVRLTEKEMELLSFLLAHRGEIMDVRTLYEAVWKSKYMPSSDNNIMVYIQRLRKKLEDDPSNPVLIRTIYGRGYQID